MGVVLTLERTSEGCGHSPRRFSGKNAKGHLESLRVLADRAPYPNPNGPGKGSLVRFVLPGATGHPASARRGGAALSRLPLRALSAKHKSWLATRTRSRREVLARRQDIHGCPDFPRVLLKILGQAVGAVDLSILLTESLSHHAFHYVVAHRSTLAVHATARAPRLRGRRKPRH